LDKEASRLGVTRQSIIKAWIADRLKDKIAQDRRANRDDGVPTPAIRYL
jgi:hypothetical protein